MPASKVVEFQGRVASFRLDVSRSGQHTLNRLVVSSLDFGYEVHRVSEFIFDHDVKVATLLGGISGDIQQVPIVNPLAQSQ